MRDKYTHQHYSQRFSFFHGVGGEHYCAAGHGGNQSVPKVAPRDRVQPCRGFVEQDDVRVANNRNGHALEGDGGSGNITKHL